MKRKASTESVLKRAGWKRIFAVYPALLFACLCFLGGGLGVSAAPRSRAENTVYSDNQGINSWWVYPLSVRYKGKSDKTYTSYVDSDGSCGLISYDNTNGNQRKVKIAREKADDHNAGAVEVLRDGRLIYITSGHNSRSYLKLYVSKEPESIRDWEEPVMLKTPAKCTYIQLVKNDKGYFLFTRLRYSWKQLSDGQSRRFTWAVSYSRDGLRWSDFRNVIDGGTVQYYVKAMPCTDSDDIRLVMSSYPRNSNTDLRVAFYNPNRKTVTDQQNKNLYRLKSKGWGLSFKKADVAVKKEKGSRNRLLDVGFTERKRTVIAYASGSDASDADYRVTEVKGKKKQTATLTNSGSAFYRPSWYFGGMAFSSKKANVLYLSRKVGRYWQIEQWKKKKTGWKRAKVVMKSRNRVLIRPFTTKNGPGYVSFSYGVYNDRKFNDFDTWIFRKRLPESAEGETWVFYPVVSGTAAVQRWHF